MSNKVLSIFLSVVFLLFITAPTIISMVDDTIDVSIIFSASEEEDIANEILLELDVLFLNGMANQFDLDFSSKRNNLMYYFKEYPKPHQNLISPPPEQNI